MQETIKQPTEAELKAVAGSYHVLGLSIIPFKLVKKGEEYEKLVLVNSWKKWETQHQTDEEFLNLNWSGANAFAIICGTQTKNGVYLSVIDYDCKGTDVPVIVKEKGKLLLREFPITCMEQTVNNGQHLIYWSKTKPKAIGTYHNSASLELLGEKKLCLMAPSYGYSKLNDNSPTELENIEQTFLEIMKNHGFIKEQTQQHPLSNNKKYAVNRPRPCIIEALKQQLTGPTGHLMRLAVAAEYKRLGYTQEELIDLFRSQLDFDFNICKTQIESVNIEKTAKCATIKEHGYCLPTCTIDIDTQKIDRVKGRGTENKDKTVLSPGMSTTDLIFEQVYNEKNGNHYIVWNRKEHEIKNQPEVHYMMCNIGENDYSPLSRLACPSVTMHSDYESEASLYAEVRDFIVKHLDVPNELYYDVYTCFTFATWRTEDFKVVPYIFFLGPMASGKTRGLECFHQLCYRSIMSTSISPAALFRIVAAWHPTLLLDETEIYNKENKTEVLALLNSGYKKGQCAIRIKDNEQGNLDIAFFDVFGFKALAGTQELVDTLQSRCIITAMSKAIRQVNMFVDEVKAQELRNKLLTYRFRNLGKIDNDMLLSFQQENPDFRNGRVIELFVSLLQVAPTLGVKQNLLCLMRQITQSRLDAEQVSIEAKVFEAVLKCSEKVVGGKISTQEITEQFNDGLHDKEQVSSRFIGRKVAALGFEKCKVGNKGQAGFHYNKTLIGRLTARYFPNGIQLTPETSESSETPVSMGKQDLMDYCSAGVTGVNSFVEKSQNNGISPLETGVSVVSDVTGVKPQNPSQVHVVEAPIDYLQMVCCFCQKKLADDEDCVSDGFTGNNPVHKKCYDALYKQLKQSCGVAFFEDYVSKIDSVTVLSSINYGVLCEYCGVVGRSDCSVIRFDGSYGFVCSGCCQKISEALARRGFDV
ncbi:MAG: hypothetical protein FWC33_02025 [Candidatus Bathyarchaeota archaeon]|nr:hypothetical protein [Candidatus Termiticorpusculum sp.]